MATDAGFLRQKDFGRHGVVNFNALAQANDFRVEKRRVVFLCWMQDSRLGNQRHQIASRLNVHLETDWAIKQNLNSIARPYDEWAFSPLYSTAIPQNFNFIRRPGVKQWQQM